MGDPVGHRRKAFESRVSDVFERAAFALVAGEIVAIPTDTVYGLAVYPERRSATDALFALKGRPPSLELPVLVSGIEQAEGLAAGGLSDVARRVAVRFWPGAVTIVVPRKRDLSWTLGGDEGTIGMRCPANPLARALCERVGPIATTSANFHGEPPIRTAGEIRTRFGDRVAMVVDGGTLEGLPSTVVDLTASSPRCVREGEVAFVDIERIASERPTSGDA